MRAALERVLPVLQSRGALAPVESRDLLESAQEEWEQNRTLWTVGIAWGRRPD